MRVVVTGAAGFIGASVIRGLAEQGHDVVGLDALLDVAHPRGARPPADVELADIRDEQRMRSLLRGADVVSHQAAMVGHGVDAADFPAYASHNDLGTAVLLAAMAVTGVNRLVLASSMVVYGEGCYRCRTHGEVAPQPREVADLEAGQFEPRCPQCRRPLHWCTVPEQAALQPRSSYAASKVAQEHYAQAWGLLQSGRAIGLRYHNVYGPGMPADTPYSGVAAIFRSALQRGEAPRVFEDGGQTRDFVHVDDVVAANLASVERVGEHPVGLTPYNICSGTPVTVGEMATVIAAACAGPDPVVTGEYRAADVRHVVASPAAAAEGLDFRAGIGPEEGLREFASAPLRGR